MRIDLPQCDFENCRRRIDGKCNSKEAFRNCLYQQLKSSDDIQLLLYEENGCPYRNIEYGCIVKLHEDVYEVLKGKEVSCNE